MSKHDEDSIKAMKLVKSIFDDKEMDINENTYVFLTMTHKKRRKVFAFYTRVRHLISANDYSFMDWAEFESVESIMHDYITFKDQSISKIASHWDENPGDYVNFTLAALAVISYPFLGVSRTA